MGFISVVKGLKTVVPVLVSMMAMMMMAAAVNNFTIQKSCCPEGVPDNINSFLCPNLSIVDSANEIMTTSSSIRTPVAALATSGFGILRDMTGKSKLLMYIGACAELITVSSFFMSAVFWSSSPWIPSMVHTFVSGGFGEGIMQLGATCILIQESNPEELPLRLQLFMSGTLLLMLLGGTLTTLILTTFGYRWLFTVCMSLHVISFLLIIILVKEKGSATKSVKESLGGLKTVFKWRENVIVLWLMLMAGPLMFSILTTEGINAAQFLQIKLQFTMYESTVFNTYHFAIAIAGSMIAPFIMRKLFRCKDFTIGIVSSVMNSIAASAFVFVETVLDLYMFSFLCVCRLASLPLPNTVISRIVNHDELGTYLGMGALLTLWIPIGVTRIYREVFSSTYKTRIGAFYFVSAGLFAVQAVIYSLSYYLFVEPKIPKVAESKETLDQNVENGKSDLPSEKMKS